MPNTFTENHLVEQPAITLFGDLDWQTFCATDEVLGTGTPLSRDTKSQVVLTARLSAVLYRLNPGIPEAAIRSAIDEIAKSRAVLAPVVANREVYDLLKNGVLVKVTDPAKGTLSDERIRIIDWLTPENNDFLLVNQLTIQGPLYTCRPDLVGFVNGLPLLVVEFKKPGVPSRQGFDENITSYKHPQNGVPQLFWYNAMLIVSNGLDSRIGSLTANWERFFEWKRIESENEPRRVSLEVLIRGTCDKARMLDLIENYTLFSELKSGLAKIVGQNHQYIGVNNAITKAMEARALGHGRGGVFWQTQGSGKSFSMVFFAQKILRKIPGNWTFVIVTDRVELDVQIAKIFKGCGVVSEAESVNCHASSGAHLRQLLGENHRYVFTLIHKFQIAEQLCDRSDVIVITDEAHRSQYDTLAMNMRAALPNALFVAFTGTPLIAGEERTREVFGDYVSIYDFQQSVEDGATVPLFYENRTPELHLDNPQLDEQMYEIIEQAGLSDDGEEKIQSILSKQYHLIVRDDRLETVAKDIVRHFLSRGFFGKAMVVSIDKATALRMYDKVSAAFATELKLVQEKLRVSKYEDSDSDEYRALLLRKDLIESTDRAVIVSAAQNEIEDMKKIGLDIEPHRLHMVNESLDEKFKEPSDPLRLVFVCAMWLTGFDAPSCSTVYLDKPMRNHTLMQTIARANRVYPGKHSGLIVDYANVFSSLEKALAIYGAGKGGANPVRDKKQLVAELRAALTEAVGFCTSRGVNIVAIEQEHVQSFDRLQKIADAVNVLIAPEEERKTFLMHARFVKSLFQAVKPDPSVSQFASSIGCISTIADEIRFQTGGSPEDVTDVLRKIHALLDESISAEGFTIREGADHLGAIDLTKIDFEKLALKFEKSNRKNVELEQLKTAIMARLNRIIPFNRTRVSYLEKFTDLINAYNAGSRTIEELFHELLELSASLDNEEQRHVREHLSEEELTIFDILTRPGPDLTNQERDTVKLAAKTLLDKIRIALVIGWKDRVSARAVVKQTIEDSLDSGLPEKYDRKTFAEKVTAVFGHVYDAYDGDGRGLFEKQG